MCFPTSKQLTRPVAIVTMTSGYGLQIRGRWRNVTEPPTLHGASGTRIVDLESIP